MDPANVDYEFDDKAAVVQRNAPPKHVSAIEIPADLEFDLDDATVPSLTMSPEVVREPEEVPGELPDEGEVVIDGVLDDDEVRREMLAALTRHDEPGANKTGFKNPTELSDAGLREYLGWVEAEIDDLITHKVEIMMELSRRKK